MNDRTHTPQLGNKIEYDAPRDAVHIAVAPVIAGEQLRPGTQVCFIAEGNTETVVRVPRNKWGGPEKMPVGVIDPFMYDEVIGKGTRCWMMLFPGTITSLRHEWTHPEFAKTDALRRIEFIAQQLDIPIKGLLGAAKRWVESGGEDWTTQFGSEDWRDNFNGWQLKQFWEAYQEHTGTQVAEGLRSNPFSCSC
jgi:hypothetical protein